MPRVEPILSHLITIQNIGPFDEHADGVMNYQVRINGGLIAEFTHKRSDGLEKCLISASKAVKCHRLELLNKAISDAKHLCATSGVER